MSTDSGSNYNVTKTTTSFVAYHDEADTTPALTYSAGTDLAQSTAFQIISDALGDVSDENLVGTLQLFNPSSTTYVKHFISSINTNSYHNYSINYLLAGYGNTTSAINAVQFKMNSGNFDGTILMFGIV
jgi:hypothetical protein